jgi:hypothetical protein
MYDIISIIVWEPPTVIQTSRLLASITIERTSILLGQQTPRSERRQFLYTAVRHSVARTSTQALANQRPQLQLHLQLARTQPSRNGIKYGPSATRSSVHQFQYDQQSVRIGSTISSSALGGSSSRQQPPLAWAAALRTIDSRPYLRRQHAACSNAMHRRPPTLPALRPGAAVRLPADTDRVENSATPKRPFSGPLNQALFSNISTGSSITSGRHHTGSRRHLQPATHGLPQRRLQLQIRPF